MPQQSDVPTATDVLDGVEHSGRTTDGEFEGMRAPDSVESACLSFGHALGASPDDPSELPFTDRSSADNPGQWYVRHDDELLGQVSQWVTDGHHIGVVSDPGTGKTALSAIIERDLGRRWDFVVSTASAPDVSSERGLFEAVLGAAHDAGIELDDDDYWQIDDGIPWRNDEVKQAVDDVIARAGATDTQLLLLVDDCRALAPQHVSALETLATAGVQLFLLGRPAARTQLDHLAERLTDPLRTSEGIEPFDEQAIAEYVVGSLSAFAGDSDGVTNTSLFSGDAISYIHDETGGVPHDVRHCCLDLFVRAAVVWDQLDAPVDRVTITSTLADRDMALPIADVIGE